MNFRLKRIPFILLYLLVMASGYCQSVLSSEEQKNKNIWQLAAYDGKAGLNGLLHAYSRPFHWDGNDFITFGAITGGTALLFLGDNETSRFFMRQEEGTPNFILEFGERFGSPQVAYGFTGSVYLFGLFTKNEKIRKTGVLLTSSAVATGLIQTISKTTFGRARPQSDGDTFTFKPFSGMAKYRSFPSGHTILSFTIAHSLARQFDNIWVKAGIYTVGMISPISRVMNGAHWLTDVGLSMAISVVTVNAIDNYLNKKQYYPSTKGSKPKKRISWNFNVGLGRVGLFGSF